MNTQTSKFWLDHTVERICQQHPEGDLIVSSGVTPSGIYHVGHLREVLSADAVTIGLRKAGRNATHLHFVDDSDAFRKVPANVPDDFSQYLGMPVYLVPAPDRSDKSYADYYFDEFRESMDRLGVDMQIMRSHELYQGGKFEDAIVSVLTKLDDAKRIIAEVSGRQLPDEWVPVQILSDDNYLNKWEYAGFNAETKKVAYRTPLGVEGELALDDGRVKLDWRLDWPARWSIWGVDAEPFGRDHATKGGSYDTGKELVKAIFDAEAPEPVPYEFINLKGHTKKMSASKGTGLVPKQVLDVMPAEILRFFVLRSRPDKTLVFDPSQGVINLIDEYAKVQADVTAGEQNELQEAYEIARVAIADSDGVELSVSGVPFTHLISIYQAARGDQEQVHHLLERSGYGEVVAKQPEVLARELSYVANWLRNYAPDNVKFEVQESLPDVELSDAQKAMLSDLADKVPVAKEASEPAQAMHEAVYELKEKHNLQPKDVFQAIYLALLGQTSGPKAGWFLTTFETDWLVKRLRLES